MDRIPQFLFFLVNSPFTVSTKVKEKYLDFVEKINPSFYYFIACMVQKELTNINGKYYWIPVAYGFISLLPFPDTYLRLLEDVAIELKAKN
jgi:hypothetical protein